MEVVPLTDSEVLLLQKLGGDDQIVEDFYRWSWSRTDPHNSRAADGPGGMHQKD